MRAHYSTRAPAPARDYRPRMRQQPRDIVQLFYLAELMFYYVYAVALVALFSLLRFVNFFHFVIFVLSDMFIVFLCFSFYCYGLFSLYLCGRVVLTPRNSFSAKRVKRKPAHCGGLVLVSFVFSEHVEERFYNGGNA